MISRRNKAGDPIQRCESRRNPAIIWCSEDLIRMLVAYHVALDDWVQDQWYALRTWGGRLGDSAEMEVAVGKKGERVGGDVIGDASGDANGDAVTPSSCKPTKVAVTTKFNCFVIWRWQEVVNNRAPTCPTRSRAARLLIHFAWSQRRVEKRSLVL